MLFQELYLNEQSEWNSHILKKPLLFWRNLPSHLDHAKYQIDHDPIQVLVCHTKLRS